MPLGELMEEDVSPFSITKKINLIGKLIKLVLI